MANAAIDQVYLLTYRGILHNQTIMTTYWYQLKAMPAGPPSVIEASDALDTALAAGGGLQATYLGICPSNYLMQEAWIQCVFPIRYRKRVYTKAHAGESVNASTTTNVSCAISRAGEVAARNTMGGVRIPLSPLDVVNGNLSGTMLVDAGDHATQMRTAIGPVGDYVWHPGILSHVYNDNGDITQTFFTPTGITVVKGSARVVRRRTVGLGI